MSAGSDIEGLAAIVAAGLVQNNSQYRICTRIGDFNQGRDPQYALDVDAIARDAVKIATKIVEYVPEEKP